MSNKKIAVFDSGLGGLSVLNTIRETMPNESLIYYGDSAFNPYGTKPLSFVQDRVFLVVEELMEKGIKALVIACNTATSASAHLLREKYDIPVLGLEPALKPAIEAGKKNILVLATEITLREKKFENLMSRFKDEANIHKVPVSKLVNIVENDLISEDSVNRVLDEVLVAKDRNQYDAVILGCTHFIFAKNEIAKYFKDAEIFDGNQGVTDYLKNILESKDLLNTSEKEETIILASDESVIERYKKYAR